jgi:hypothetical protein
MEKPGIPLVEAFKMMQVNEEDSPVENGEAIHEEVCFCILKCHMCKTIDFLCLFIASNSVIWDFSVQFVRDYANYCPPDCFTCMRNKAGTVWALYIKKMNWINRQKYLPIVFAEVYAMGDISWGAAKKTFQIRRKIILSDNILI